MSLNAFASLFAWVVTVTSFAMTAAAHPIVTEGHPTSVIVVAEDAKGCVPAAVEELVAGVREMTGVELPVEQVNADNLTDVQAKLADSQPILVGRSAWTDSLELPVPTATDGFIIKSVSDTLVVLGNDADEFDMSYARVPATAGTFYGVIRLLEQMGARFFISAPEFAVRPQHTSIQLDRMDIADAPYFRYRLSERAKRWRRQAGYGGDVDPWATRHTFAQLYNWEQLFTESHPDYFSYDENNTLSNNLYMIGFPHEGVIDRIIEQARKYFSSDRIEGKRNYFLVIQNDYFMEACSCDVCQRMVDYDRGRSGQYSDYMAYAVVKVAEAIKDDFPNAYVVYCAYEAYLEPPQTMSKLPDNVIMLIAQNRHMSFDPEERERMNDLVRAWQALEPAAISFCRYYMNGSHIIPRLNLRGIAANIHDMKSLSETGKSPIIGEMHFTRDGYWWFDLNEYITARALWQPDLDVDALLDDFATTSFGPAAEPMLAYINQLEAFHVEDRTRGTFTRGQLAILGAYLDEAKARAGEDSAYATRIAFIVDHFHEIERTMNEIHETAERAANEADQSVTGTLKPVIRYDFDVSLSEVVLDTSGHERHGILVDTKRVDSGRHHKALAFDGERAYVKLREPVELSGAYTLEAWIYPEAMDRQQQVLGELTNMYRPYHVFGSTANNHAYDHVSVSLRGGMLFFHDSGVASITDTQQVALDTWSHVVATYSPDSGMRLYVNGELAAFSGPRQRRANSDPPFLHLIGATGGISSRYANTIADCRGFFHGQLDQVRVYNQELPYAAVRQRYHAR